MGKSQSPSRSVRRAARDYAGLTALEDLAEETHVPVADLCERALQLLLSDRADGRLGETIRLVRRSRRKRFTRYHRSVLLAHDD